MHKCPICKQERPFEPLREQTIRDSADQELQMQSAYWRRVLDRNRARYNHHSKVQRRAYSRIKRLGAEILRRQRSNDRRKRDQKKAGFEKATKAA